MGSDDIAGQMLECDCVVLPLKVLFQNILDDTIYPNIWKPHTDKSQCAE